MSFSPGNREVAHRVFAAEYDDASLEYAESDEERAPNYVVTPTGARVNRLFVVGVLTAVEAVNEETVRARVVDPTGAFVVYAGQYQPDELAFLERAEPPLFVAVTGKANAFRPEGSDRVLTSVRPESVNEVDAETRDRWVVGTAEQTCARIGTFASALDRSERGDDLASVLRENGVEPGLAAGIARAIDHYGTTPEYLATLRERAVEAVEVVAGDREEVTELNIDPGEQSGEYDPSGLAESAPQDVTAAVEASPAARDSTEDGADADDLDESPTATEAAPSSSVTSDEQSVSSPESESVSSPESESVSSPESESVSSPESEIAVEENSESDSTVTPDTDDRIADFEGGDLGDERDDVSGDDDLDVDEDELYEVDDEERERIEEEHGLEFSSGNEVDDPGETDIETPAPEDASDAEEVDDTSTGVDDARESTATIEEEPAPTADEDLADAEQSEATDATDEDEREADLDEVLLARMDELDDGDGANREALIEDVVEVAGVPADAVEDAIEDAMMGGRCYEPDEGRLKSI